MSISSIHPIGRVNPTPPVIPRGNGGIEGYVTIDKLPISQDIDYIKNDVETSRQEYAGTRQNRDALIRLFSTTLNFGIDIVPLPSYIPVLATEAQGKVTVEATFSPPPLGSTGRNPCISLQLSREGGPSSLKAPTNGIDPFVQSHVEEFADHVLSCFNDPQIVRLIIVTTHELGHYLSYKDGNHTKNLRIATEHFNKRQVNQMTSEHKKLIWLEECLAWAYAAQTLSQIGFEGSNDFDPVKIESLKAYFRVLKMKDLNLDTYLQLLKPNSDYQKVIDEISPLLFQINSASTPKEASPFPENRDIYSELKLGKRIVPV